MGPRELGGTKPRRVLLALLLHRGAPVSKDQLVSLLWEGSPPRGAKATLESYVCLLRKKLQPCHERQTSLITTLAGGYAIDMSRVDLDLVRYEQLMAAALQPDVSAADALPMLEQAMTFAGSPLLPGDVGSEWLDEVRRTHNQKVRKNMIAAALKIADLQSESAQQWARRALDEDPLDESAWHALLNGLEASGRHADGLREYNRCRKLFAAELGCAPGPGLQALYVRLLRGANEDDQELSRLFDAVVSLHTASRLGPQLSVRPRGSEPGAAKAEAAAIEQACRALDLLLRKVGVDRQDLDVAYGT